MRCLLCDLEQTRTLCHQQWDVAFYHCQSCDLIFRDPQSFPDWDQQKTRYDHHNNSPDDPRYLEYFQKFILPLRAELEARGLKTGLDWGAGPGPALGLELMRLGYQVQNYDPIYFPKKPSGKFDFITCTEVIEHFQTPNESLNEIFEMIKGDGLFAGLTNFHPGPAKFSDWWYAKDVTHVCFYSEQTMRWIQRKWRLRSLCLQSPIFIFQVQC